MTELLKLTQEEWNIVNQMLISSDEESVNLGFGFIENIDYTNKEQIDLFNDSFHLFLEHPSTNDLHQITAKYIYHYFESLSKFNLSSK